jgi:hypothetical protein
VLQDFNNIHPKLTFTSELEKDNKLNFLNINIHKRSNSLQATVCRKPTTTDCIIPYNSNHLNEQKQASIRYFINRVNKYPIDNEEIEKEINTIKYITHNNSFPKQLIVKTIQKTLTSKQKTNKNPKKEKRKWITFTYTRKGVYRITNIFKT